MGRGALGCHRGGVPSAPDWFARRPAMVVSRRVAANSGRACRPAQFSAIEENGGRRGEKNLSEGGPGEPSSAGTDPAPAPYQRSGNARPGSRPVEVEIVRPLGSWSGNGRKQRRLGNATFPCQ